MTEKQAFSVLVRALGVLVVLHGARVLWIPFINWVWPYAFPRGPEPFVVVQDFVYSLVVLVLGSTMIRWPEWVVRFAWPEKAESSN
jgi:hypothetical protein